MYSAFRVDEWVNIPVDDLTANGPLYTSIYDVDREEIVDLLDYPMLDEDNREVPIYTEDGSTVDRREPRVWPGTGQCAILVDLDNIRALFDDPNPDDDMSDFEPFARPNATINAFRQGFLKSAGHVQVNNVPHDMARLLTGINRNIALNAVPSDEVSDDGQDDSRPMPALSGIDCQMYNAVMHRVRGTANTHDAQRGDVTAAFAGSYSAGVPQRRTAKRLKDACTNRLPHENFRIMIDHDGLDTSLRIENVFRLDMMMVKAGTCVPFSVSSRVFVDSLSCYSGMYMSMSSCPWRTFTLIHAYFIP